MKIRICALLAAACCIVSSARALDGTPNPADSVIVKLIDFRDVKLFDALKILAEQTGLNMVASAEAGKTIVSMTLRNVPAKLAVETLCKAHNLWYKDDTGIVRVMTTQEFQRDIVTFREEKTEVFTLLYPNAVAISVAIRDLYGDRVQLSLGNEERTDETIDLNERLDRFDVIDQRSQGIGAFGGSGVSGVGGGGFGGSSGLGFSGAGNNRNFGSGGGSGFASSRSQLQRESIRNRDDATGSVRGRREELNIMTPDELQALQKQGVNAEAVEKLLTAHKRQQSDIYIALSRRNNLVAVRSSDQRAMEDIAKLVRRLDVPTSVLLLEVKVMAIDLGKDLNSAFDFQFSDGVSSAGGFNSGDIQPPVADLLRGALRKQAPLALGGSGLTPGSLAFQYVNANFRARLQALEGKNKVTTLATPLLMTANNEVSRLFVGEERPIIRNVSSNAIVNENTVTNTNNSQIEFRPVGTTLLITPNINADRTVTLRILQENSAIKRNDATIPVVTSNGDLQQQQVDVVATRSVSGTVVAQDGLSLAIGGLIEENIGDNRQQIPLLGSIPGVGVLFRRQNKTKTRSELVIVIRPRILTTPCEGEAVSKELLEKLSIHPKALCPEGTLNLYGPQDVLPKQKY